MTPFPKLQPPRPRKRHLEVSQHGDVRIDEYAWLRDDNWRAVMDDPSVLDPDIREHLETENKYAQSAMAGTETLQNDILTEMKGRIQDIDSAVPVPDGPWLYYQRMRAGDQYGVYARRPKDRQDEQILLDADALALLNSEDGSTFFDLAGTAHSDDHRLLAYALDSTGAERYALHVIDITSGQPVCRPIENTAGDFVWAKDGRTIFWVIRDENNRPYRVMRRGIIGGGEAEIVYTESDPGFFVGLERSDSSDFVEIHCRDHTSSEIWLIEANAPHTSPRCAAPRQAGVEYSLHDHGRHFYILTNSGGAVDFKIMRAPINADSSGDWEDYVPHRPGTLIIGIETFENHLVRIERENALPRIVIRDMRSGDEHEIAFDDAAYSLGLVSGYEYKTPWLRFSYSSPVRPDEIYDYHMHSKERILKKRRAVPSGHKPDDYQTERLMITARDGEHVPVTLIRARTTPIDGSAPCLLYGYGSYGITIPASFRTSILSLIDRGFVYAVAHIRGSKAKGYQWYLDGKLENKHRTFDDFVDAGRALAARGYTSEGRIVGMGGSAGGMLAGAALNQAPALFGGIIAAVPFVDVLTTMSDDSLPLTPPEWPEWGNPIKSKAAYHQIKAYSPYDNIRPANYPPVLITAGLTDPRVTYWEPAKWAARLRDHQTGATPILLKTNMDAGHQGETGRYGALTETAFEFAFALKCVA